MGEIGGGKNRTVGSPTRERLEGHRDAQYEEKAKAPKKRGSQYRASSRL
jgi:hypothetical protein